MTLQHTDVQEAMQRLRVLEKKVSRIHVLLSRSLLPRESVRLGLSAVATGERSVSVASRAFIIFVILLAWVVAFVAFGHDQLFKMLKTRLPLTDFTLNIPNISSFLTFH